MNESDIAMYSPNRKNIKFVVHSLIALLFMFILFHPGRHAKYYHYEKDEDILSQLVPADIKQLSSATKYCNYFRVIENQYEIIYYEDYLSLPPIHNLKKGGFFEPNDCQYLFSTAVIVPYRNRKDHLKIFLEYIHRFLQYQNIKYRIFIVEQNNSEPFNRAMLLNYGAQAAFDENFPCLILHDVDLIPLNTGNIYACSISPRHMSSSVDTMRFNLPYHEIAGGVVAIQSSQFRLINGMSNSFSGWGGEDDDFFMRLSTNHLTLSRFSPRISRYIMLPHKREIPSSQRYDVLKTAKQRQKQDGLNSLTRNITINYKDLYTHLIVN